VDDNPANLKVLFDYLKDNGFRVMVAVDAEAAMESIARIPPDIILLDVMMPGIDGFSLAKQLKTDDQTENIPLIFLTVMAEPIDKLKGFQLGAVDYITKPINVEEVAARLNTHLSLRKVRKTLEAKNQALQHEVAEHKRTEKALRESQARYREIAQENAQLLAQARRDSEIKSELLHEVNHRVSNNLASLLAILSIEQRHAAQQDNDDAVEVLRRFIGRVEGMTTVHQMLSRSEWAPVPLHDLAREVIRGALNALPPDQGMRVNVAPSPVVVTPRQASNLALIINELVTNTIKHGLGERQWGQVDVEIAQHEGEVELTYRDNGPGYPAFTLNGEGNNVGLYLVRQLVRTLHGSLELRNDGGAVTTLRFKTT
jgi:two-component sensor histidine kinase